MLICKPTVQIDDDKVKLTRWDFLPGAETGWHRHEMDYVVVPLTDGTLTAEMPDSSVVENTLTVGASYVRPVGVEHNIINNKDTLVTLVCLECCRRGIAINSR
jgi:quercetin dioxygenase-like cupin family protein